MRQSFALKSKEKPTKLVEEAPKQTTEASDFLEEERQRVVGWISGAVAVAVLPFTINNVVQGRWSVAFFALFVFMIVANNALYPRLKKPPILNIKWLIPVLAIFLFVCFYTQGFIAVFWSYPAVVLMYFLYPFKRAWRANVTFLSVTVSAGFWFLELPLALRFLFTLLLTSMACSFFVRVIIRQQARLHEIAVHDSLTGLLNRVLLKSTLEKTQARTRRTEQPSTVLLFDIDHFKSINDQFGHDVGDRVLQRVANLARRRVRANDSVFRIGGEEFLILLDGTDEEAGVGVAEAIRAGIESAELLDNRAVTVSIGVTELSVERTVESLLKICDEKLYKAKRAGRNRVMR